MKTVKLTEKQQLVFDELRKIGRQNAYKYLDKQAYLHQEDLRKIALGDVACVFGMGGLSYQVAHRLGTSAPSVLSIFKESFLEEAADYVKKPYGTETFRRSLPSMEIERVTQFEYDTEWFPAKP